MMLRINLPHVLAWALLIAVSSACAQPADSPAPRTTSLDFNGATYVHRWSQDGQHEFTPAGQEDLETWTDMVTVNIHESVRDGDQLAATANSVLSNYQGSGEVVRTDSRPRTETAPAEHFIAAVLGNPGFLEAAFARLMLVDGRGVVLVYSHRVYGQPAGPAMSEWMGANGQQFEDALMSWRDAPAVATALRESN